MDLFFDRPHSVDVMILKNQLDKTFPITHDSRLYEIPRKSLFRCPCSHYPMVMQQPGATEAIIIVDPAKGTTEYLESEKRRLAALVEQMRATEAKALADLKQADEDLKVATTRLGLKEVPTKEK